MKRILIIPPDKRSFRSLGDQALILWLISKIGIQNKFFILMWRWWDLSFLLGLPQVSIINLPVRDFWLIRFLLDFFLFFFKIFSFFFTKVNHVYYIGADMVDGRFLHMSPYFLCVIILNKFISYSVSVVSFSYKKCYTRTSFFLFYFLRKTAIFHPRDKTSFNALAKDFSPDRSFVITDLSFCLDRHIFKTTVHDWVSQRKRLWNKILMFCPSKNSSINDIDNFLSKMATELNDWEEWSFVIVRHVFSPVQHQWIYCKFIHSLLKDKAILLDIPNVLIVRDILYNADITASCLMHFALWSIVAGKPVVMMDYDKKALPIFADLWIEDMVAQNENDFFIKMRKLKTNFHIYSSHMVSAKKIAEQTALNVSYE